MDKKASESKGTVLIVDDEIATGKVFNRTLTRNGYNCHWASDASIARQLLTEHGFDVVLCDIVMPGESGLELGRFIKSTWPHLPLIIVTGLEDLDTAREALALDIYGYIIKPASRSQVLISVSNALRRSELEKEHRTYRIRLEKEVRIRTDELIASNETLQKSKEIIAQKVNELEKLNNALNILLKKNQESRAAMEADVVANVKRIIHPYLEKLKASRLSAQQIRHLDMIDQGIRRIISPFTQSLSNIGHQLTPSELHIADLIRQGKSTKEISTMLNLSENTIMTHRYKIRTKLGLKNSSQNLFNYLNSLSNQ